MRAVLISTYELGHQPFGLASPAAWLRRAGWQVTCLDLSRGPLDEEAVRAAHMIALHLPMHTATRLAVALLPGLRDLNPDAYLCFYGLYAQANEDYLRDLGVHAILGGEFEDDLVKLAALLSPEGSEAQAAPQLKILSEAPAHNMMKSGLPRLKFITPDRSGLPALRQYAHVVMPEGSHRVAGYTEASRGCKHLCRHCPVVPAYAGQFRVVQPDVVLADIRQQVAAGAQHITFGDADFFNGPKHALRVVEDLHRQFPEISYDVTIKVEHLLKHAHLLPRLRHTGCLFVTSAAESLDDAVLCLLEKGHTRSGFLRAVELCRAASLPLQPTFVPFTPWTTLEGYAELLGVLADLDLVPHVAPIQLAIRLLIPEGSRLLELPEVRRLVGPFDPAALAYPWRHADPRVDELQREVEACVQSGEKLKRPRTRIFERIWDATQVALSAITNTTPAPRPLLASRATIPYLNEPWYC
jgi:radical SAM superfamily enzyme YgiQ (UPF0313 family)